MAKQQPNLSPPKNFEQAVDELEQILRLIEAGELGLEETLVKYERGNFLIQHCRGVLNGAEKQIELLSRSADGGLASEPLAEEPRGAGAQPHEGGDDEAAGG